MNQPTLGKKIIELRKAKGLTQEELVSKCNLNVRTLQRIESGEVTPRIYTLKTLFKALDYEYEVNKKTEQTSELPFLAMLEKKISEVNNHKFNLLNFKTNKMKKILILLILTLCFAFLGSGFITAQKNSNSNKLVGTWVLCNSHGESIYDRNNVAEFKIITPQSFTVLVLSKGNKTVSAELMGIYTLEKDIYTETITHAFQGMTDFPGTVNSFTIKFKDDLLIIDGQNNTYTQTWKKVNPEELRLKN